MFQNRRTVFLFVCAIVFVQALYYIVTLQVRKNEPNIINSVSILAATYNKSSDRKKTTVQRPLSNTSISTSIQINSTHELISPNVTLKTSTVYTTVNLTSPTTSTSLPKTTLSTNTTISTTLPKTTLPTNTTISTTLPTTTTTTTTTTTPIPFSNASFYSSFNFTKLESNISNSLPICNYSITNNDTSIYKVTISQTLYSYEIIESHVGKNLHPGGHSIPKSCRAEQRLALIICYRNREQHLKMFLDNIHPFLQKQQLDYTIFIVNQNGNDQFNRAALFNVAYIEAMKLYPFDCFIFHDVDLLPEDLRNIYKCGDQPRHMSVAVDKFNYKLLYSTLFGGVTAFRLSDFVGANGYPTVYWGWGGEDDDMYLRVVTKLKKSITRYPMEIARYKMVRTHDHTSGKANPHRHTILYSKYDYNLDGINTTNYTLHNLIFYKLFTLINVTLTEESFEQIRTRLRIKKKQKK